jgi:hypothetical protein
MSRLKRVGGKAPAPAASGRSSASNTTRCNTQRNESQVQAQHSLTITLRGNAAQQVAQLMHVEIPDLWHMALHPVHKADKEGILLVWYVAHDLKRALQQREGGQP